MRPLLHDDPDRLGVHLLLARLGSGGTGVVYLARSPGGRLVAVKAVHAERAADPAFRERFGREAAALQAAGGAFTAPLVDADPGAPRPWLATVYLPGVTLGDAVAGTGPMPGPSVDALGAGLAEALASIHRAGVAHRDLKPSNVLLTRDGPRLLDLGMAGPPGSGPAEAGGTPAYLPPEQAAGGEGGPPGDVFALAAVLVFALTGRSPFDAESVPAVLYRVLHQGPDLGGVTDPALRGFLAACLGRQPGGRPDATGVLDFFTARNASAAALPPAVAAWIEDTARRIPAPDAPPWRSPRPARRRVLRNTLLWSGAAVLAAAGGTAGVPAVRGRGSSTDVWRRSLPEGLDGVFPAGAALLALGRDLGAYAMDGATGERRWHRPDVDVSTAPGVLMAGDVPVVHDAQNVQALDPATGAQRWRVGNRTLVPPAADRDVVCVSGVRGSPGSGEFVVAYDLRTGEQRWQVPSPFSQGGAAIAGGVAYLPGAEGWLEAVDTATGRSRWRARLGEDRADFRILTPVVVNGAVYVSTSYDQVHALSAADGKRRWTARMSESTTGLQTERVLAVGDAVYTISEQGVVQCFDAATGRQRWRLPLATRVHDPVAELLTPVGDLVMVMARRTLLGVGAADGRERWRRELGLESAAPVLAGGLGHARSLDGIVSVDPADGRILRTLAGDDYSVPSTLRVYRDRLVFSVHPDVAVAVRPR